MHVLFGYPIESHHHRLYHAQRSTSQAAEASFLLKGDPALCVLPLAPLLRSPDEESPDVISITATHITGAPDTHVAHKKIGILSQGVWEITMLLRK